MALDMLYKHYAEKENALKKLYPELELTGSLKDDEPFFDRMVEMMDRRFRTVHQQALSQGRGTAVAAR